MLMLSSFNSLFISSVRIRVDVYNAGEFQAQTCFSGYGIGFLGYYFCNAATDGTKADKSYFYLFFNHISVSRKPRFVFFL